jgi:hypothetical protein
LAIVFTGVPLFSFPCVLGGNNSAQKARFSIQVN